MAGHGQGLAVIVKSRIDRAQRSQIVSQVRDEVTGGVAKGFCPARPVNDDQNDGFGGGLEGWRVGGLEGWKVGGLEGWEVSGVRRQSWERRERRRE
ncbi:MAG: hypothetical protein DPW09_27280 [Anaerolineae bacterium]|nr:hypothetical protein [Anaerolineae bacterium]